jgi:hypothetical protein
MPEKKPKLKKGNYTYNGINYRYDNKPGTAFSSEGVWYKEINGKYLPLTKGDVAKRSEILAKQAKFDLGDNYTYKGNDYIKNTDYDGKEQWLKYNGNYYDKINAGNVEERIKELNKNATNLGKTLSDEEISALAHQSRGVYTPTNLRSVNGTYIRERGDIINNVGSLTEGQSRQLANYLEGSSSIYESMPNLLGDSGASKIPDGSILKKQPEDFNYAFGGSINNMKNQNQYASGGQLTQFNGPSHEENSLQGIPQGPTATVEGNETKQNNADYIYSDRNIIDAEIANEFSLPKKWIGKSFADASKLANRSDSKREDDVIEQQAIAKDLDKLREAQETWKAKELEKDIAMMQEKHPEFMANLTQPSVQAPGNPEEMQMQQAPQGEPQGGMPVGMEQMGMGMPGQMAFGGPIGGQTPPTQTPQQYLDNLYASRKAFLDAGPQGKGAMADSLFTQRRTEFDNAIIAEANRQGVDYDNLMLGTKLSGINNAQVQHNINAQQANVNAQNKQNKIGQHLIVAPSGKHATSLADGGAIPSEGEPDGTPEYRTRSYRNEIGKMIPYDNLTQTQQRRLDYKYGYKGHFDQFGKKHYTTITENPGHNYAGSKPLDIAKRAGELHSSVDSNRVNEKDKTKWSNFKDIETGEAFRMPADFDGDYPIIETRLVENETTELANGGFAQKLGAGLQGVAGLAGNIPGVGNLVGAGLGAVGAGLQNVGTGADFKEVAKDAAFGAVKGGTGIIGQTIGGITEEMINNNTIDASEQKAMGIQQGIAQGIESRINPNLSTLGMAYGGMIGNPKSFAPGGYNIVDPVNPTLKLLQSLAANYGLAVPETNYQATKGTAPNVQSTATPFSKELADENLAEAMQYAGVTREQYNTNEGGIKEHMDNFAKTYANRHGDNKGGSTIQNNAEPETGDVNGDGIVDIEDEDLGIFGTDEFDEKPDEKPDNESTIDLSPTGGETLAELAPFIYNVGMGLRPSDKLNASDYVDRSNISAADKFNINPYRQAMNEQYQSALNTAEQGLSGGNRQAQARALMNVANKNMGVLHDTGRQYDAQQQQAYEAKLQEQNRYNTGVNLSVEDINRQAEAKRRAYLGEASTQLADLAAKKSETKRDIAGINALAPDFNATYTPYLEQLKNKYSKNKG